MAVSCVCVCVLKTHGMLHRDAYSEASWCPVVNMQQGSAAQETEWIYIRSTWLPPPKVSGQIYLNDFELQNTIRAEAELNLVWARLCTDFSS